MEKFKEALEKLALNLRAIIKKLGQCLCRRLGSEDRENIIGVIKKLLE